ncbi:MAG: proline dehydrogenase family protein [Breznakibacter sp.]
MLHRTIASLLPYMPKKLVWVFSKRYIAGPNIGDAVRVSRMLNGEGCMVTIDLLGEFITNLDEARENCEAYLDIVDRFTAEGIQGNFSVKPTSFGLLIDREACYGYIRQIVERASRKDNFVRIDMEDSKCVDMEIELYLKLKAEFPHNVGLVLQAYLRRTLADVDAMMKAHSESKPLNFRLCKGIYVEPESIAFKDKQEISRQYLNVLEAMLSRGIYVGIATHDKFVVRKAFELIEKYKISADKYEFQMLYGVTPELRKEVVSKGHRMRVYIPYGQQWFGYSTRRLKENPNMVRDIIKALFVRG